LTRARSATNERTQRKGAEKQKKAVSQDLKIGKSEGKPVDGRPRSGQRFGHACWGAI